jgi:hypothetical protein
MSSKRSSSTCNYKGCPREFRLGVLHDFKLIARKLLEADFIAATLYSSGCVMVVTLSP